MIRRIRAFVSLRFRELSPRTDVAVPRGPLDRHDGRRDAELDILLKHAMRNDDRESSRMPDVAAIWVTLSGRVRGPFGRVAVEGPSDPVQEIRTAQGLNYPFVVDQRSSAALAHAASEVHRPVDHAEPLVLFARELVSLR